MAKQAPGTAKPDRIAFALEEDIRSGRLAYGDRLQSEHDLVRRFSVSRNTVRKGLEELSSRGLITTKMGAGSFVTFNGRTINDAIGWSRALADAGIDADTRTLRLEVIEDTALASLLEIENATFVAVDRVRSLRDSKRAISIERSRLPLLPELEDVPLRGLRQGSLHETMRAAGLFPDHGEEWAELHRLNAGDAALLGCKTGAAFLQTRRLVRAKSGQPIEHVVSLLNPDFFALHLEF